MAPDAGGAAERVPASAGAGGAEPVPASAGATLRLDNDVAVLDEPAPVAPVTPLPPVIGLTEADLGARLNFVGFGVDEDQESGVKLQTDGALGGLGCTVAGCPAGADEATQISYSMVESGPCFGDSGGPAFLYRGGAPYLAGVTSYGDEGCSAYGASTRVDAYFDFLSEYLGVDAAPPSARVERPAEGEALASAFAVEAAVDDDEQVVRVDLYIDGALVETRFEAPWRFEVADGLAAGAHTIEVVAYDTANEARAAVAITSEDPAGAGDSGGGGCSAGRPAPGPALLFGFVALAWGRRRRVSGR